MNTLADLFHEPTAAEISAAWHLPHASRPSWWDRLFDVDGTPKCRDCGRRMDAAKGEFRCLRCDPLGRRAVLPLHAARAGSARLRREGAKGDRGSQWVAAGSLSPDEKEKARRMLRTMSPQRVAQAMGVPVQDIVKFAA